MYSITLQRDALVCMVQLKRIHIFLHYEAVGKLSHDLLAFSGTDLFVYTVSTTR